MAVCGGFPTGICNRIFFISGDIMNKILEGLVVSSAGIGRKQIVFDDNTGLITSVGDVKVPRENVDYFYDDDCLVFAGFIDIHVHAREDVTGKFKYKEDFRSISRAAVNGGVTAMADMPNNPSPPIDEKSYYEKLSLISPMKVPIFLYAGIGNTTLPLGFDVPYKLFMSQSVGDLFFDSEKALENTLRHYEGESVSFHCEDGDILKKCKNKDDHFARRPAEAEVVSIGKAIKLIEKYSLKGKICHVSTGEGLLKILAAKDAGICVKAEVTPWHLYYNHEGLNTFERNFFQVNPPIRKRHDQQMLLKHFIRGDIDFLATDHAPHTLTEKQDGISGLTGLDTFGPFVSWMIKEKNVSLEIIAKTCAENPGTFLNQFLPSLNEAFGLYNNLGKGLGLIEEEHTASFTVLNTKKSITIRNNLIKSKASWSPFEGKTFPGSVHEVFVNGRTNIDKLVR